MRLLGLGKGTFSFMKSFMNPKEDLKSFSLYFIANALKEVGLQLHVTRSRCFPMFLFSAKLLLLCLDELHLMAMVN